MVQLQKKWRGAGKVERGYVPRRCVAYYSVTADAFQMNPIMIHSNPMLYSVESTIIFFLSVLLDASTFTVRVMRHKNDESLNSPNHTDIFFPPTSASG